MRGTVAKRLRKMAVVEYLDPRKKYRALGSFSRFFRYVKRLYKNNEL